MDEDDEFTEIFTLYTTTKCIDEGGYPHVPSDFWINILVYGPYFKIFATVGLFILSRYLHPKPLYLFLMSIAAFVDIYGVNNLLRNYVFEGRHAPVAGCGGTSVFPNWPTELTVLLGTLITTFPLFYKSRRDVFQSVLVLAAVCYIVAGQVYLNYATVFQTAVGAWIGVLEGMIIQVLFYMFVNVVVHHSPSKKKTSVFGYTLYLNKDSSLLLQHYFKGTSFVF